MRIAKQLRYDWKWCSWKQVWRYYILVKILHLCVFWLEFKWKSELSEEGKNILRLDFFNKIISFNEIWAHFNSMIKKTIINELSSAKQFWRENEWTDWCRYSTFIFEWNAEKTIHSFIRIFKVYVTCDIRLFMQRYCWRGIFEISSQFKRSFGI